MREILFRGKRCDNGEWAEGDLVRSYLKMGNACITDFAKGVVLGVDNATVGQYTGLTDKNGKKIFEGDIVRGVDTDIIRTIEYHGNRFALVSTLRHFFDVFYSEDWEIIGNIHDNPELLGGKENADRSADND